MRLLLVVALATMCPGFSASAASRAGSVFSPGLGHVVVKINGDQSTVDAGQALHVYRGDNIVFVSAESRDRGARAANLAIDVEGFSASGQGQASGDDRGVEIATAGLEGRAFAVKVRSGEKAVGQIKLVVAEPRFDYAVILVNDEPVTVRPGGKVQLNPSDAVRVQGVRTNIPDPSKVEVDATSTASTGGGSLRFKYRGRVFGEIRLAVNGSRKNGVRSR